MRREISILVLGMVAAALAAPWTTGCSSSDGAPPAAVQLDSVRAERDASGTYTLSWTLPATSGSAPIIEVTGGTSPSAIDHQKVLARTTGGTSVTVPGLDPGRRWYFAVGSPGAAGVVVAERHLALAGAANFRDLGGYPTTDGHTLRWGQIYRTDALAHLQPSDTSYLHALGLSRVVDLRTDAELTVAPDTLATDAQISYSRDALVLPIDAKTVLTSGVVVDEKFMIDTYDTVVDTNAAVFATLFSDFADADTRSMAVHCTAGKDRTGIAAALLLAALGVSDDVIGQDYALTDTYIAQIVAAQEDQLRAQGIDPAKLGVLLKSPPEVIVATLAHVREKYGSVDAYLASGGFDAAALAKLRAALRSP